MLWAMLFATGVLSVVGLMLVAAYGRREAKASRERIEWARSMKALCEKYGGENVGRIGVKRVRG